MQPPHATIVFFCVLGSLTSVPPRVARADASGVRATTLGAAVDAAMARGPGVEAAKAPMSSLSEAAIRARQPLLTPPFFSLAVGRRDGAAGAGLEAQLSVGLEVPLRDVSAARGAWVRSASLATASDVRRAQLDAALRAGVAWSRLREARAVRELRERSLVQAEAVATLAQRRAGAGVGAPLEVALARGEAGAAKAGVVDAEGLETEARAELRAAMGAEPDAQIDADGELCAPAAPVLDESGSLARARRDEPALRLADARAQLAAREVDVVRATSGPTLGLSASLLREGTGDAVALAAVSFPLPFFERSDFEVSRLRGTVDLASATLARTRSELERSVRLAVHDRHHSRELYSTLRDEAHKPLASALATATAQYEAGTIDAAALLLARQRAFVVEEQVTRACGEIRRADLRWLRAVGAAEGDR